MAKCLIPLSEITVGLIVAHKASPDETYDEVVRRALEFVSASPALHSPAAQPRDNGGGAPGHVVRLFGSDAHVASLADALEMVLVTLARRDPGFLERLSRQGWRTRRIVGRSPESLYPGSPHLTKYACRLDGGWWMGTNYSQEDIARAVRTACDVAGVVEGNDVALTLMPPARRSHRRASRRTRGVKLAS